MAKSLANRKKQTLINNEYYNMQQKFDTLYKYSNEGRNFYKLFDMIVDKNNIKLAYRNIQNNKGSNTPGVDGLTIDYLNTIDIIEMVKRKLNSFCCAIPALLTSTSRLPKRLSILSNILQTLS